ncbi:MAG: SGNH/GDSL hydrolase family protein [Candidatus Peribacteraceae bacterium]|nr:SGNH/GDSL hydrolase family protein [Candidatus Peribacteraceae bacterium]
MRKRYRGSWKNLSLTLATVVIFFFGIEIAVRVTGIESGKPRTPPIYEKSADAALSYALRPNLNETAFRATVVTDRRGFRSEEVHAGKKTVAILGDSIAFGYGLDNAQTLSAKLNDAFGGTFNVVNASVPGYTLGQEIAIYKEKVEVLHPETLVLVFYWNDLTDTEPAVLDDDGNLQAPGWTPEQPKCHPIEDGILGWIPGSCWLDLHSAFYRTVKKIVIARTESRNLQEQQEEYRKNAFGDEVTEAALKKYAQTLAAFVQTLPRTTNLLFVIWPEKRLHLQSTQELREIAEAQDFRVLNLYEVFGNKAESLSWDTVHPNAKTVDEAAGVIKAALEEWKLLPL